MLWIAIYFFQRYLHMHRQIISLFAYNSKSGDNSLKLCTPKKTKPDCTTAWCSKSINSRKAFHCYLNPMWQTLTRVHTSDELDWRVHLYYHPAIPCYWRMCSFLDQVVCYKSGNHNLLIVSIQFVCWMYIQYTIAGEWLTVWKVCWCNWSQTSTLSMMLDRRHSHSTPLLTWLEVTLL